MLTFAILVFLAGAALGSIVRLPALIGIAGGLIVAVLFAAAVTSTGLGGGVPLLATLVVSVVGLQAGYGCAVIARGVLAHYAAPEARRETVREEPRSRKVISALGDGHLDRAHQDWSSRNQP